MKWQDHKEECSEVKSNCMQLNKKDFTSLITPGTKMTEKNVFTTREYLLLTFTSPLWKKHSLHTIINGSHASILFISSVGKSAADERSRDDIYG